MIPPAATERSPPVARFDGRIAVDVPSKRFGIFLPLPPMDNLLFPARGHLLAALAPRTEILIAIGDCRRTFPDDLGFEVGDDCFDLALLQARGRVRRLLVADVGF